ncbi:hypothetical protein [Draconibacterium mangrovi]|uniref:hypothetical protein n=1 Tax=Draconibacterium mangrovi TaxID=2697469 RepID=UPI0013D30E48|nr:hypothetical protein [Draconibacterium mangrovi]
MNEVHQFLLKTYAKTNRPLFPVILLKLAFGPTTVVQLNELRKEGIVKRTNAANQTFAELLKTE